jgi:hypothetical protein
VQRASIDHEGRQRQYGGGRCEATLTHIEDKLLFILYDMKIYPLQAILAFECGMAQSTAKVWMHLLSEILQQALAIGGHVPERPPKQLATVLESEQESVYGVDGTEQRCQRPRDQEKQRCYDSGKKKHIRSSIS